MLVQVQERESRRVRGMIKCYVQLCRSCDTFVRHILSLMNGVRAFRFWALSLGGLAGIA